MNSPVAAHKARLRRELRQRRASLTSTQRRAAAQRAARHLLRDAHLRASRRVAAYLAAGSEIDTTALIRALRRAGKTVYVPRIDAHRAGRMQWAVVHAHNTLRTRRFGIREPRVTARARHAPPRIQVMILPLVGFDARGLRLGAGGGYYDRWLARARPRPWCIGLAFAVQEAPQLPAEEWDQRLDAICTEQGLRYFPRHPSPHEANRAWPTG